MKPKRIQNKELLSKYHAMNCLVCGVLFCDPCHLKSKGAGGDDHESNIIPLCRVHHSEQHQIGICTFIQKYSTVLTYVQQFGWTIDCIFGKFKLKREKK